MWLNKVYLMYCVWHIILNDWKKLHAIFFLLQSYQFQK